MRAFTLPRVLVLQDSERQSGLLADTEARRRPRERTLARHAAAATARLDGRLLHEMLFGAVPLSMSGVASKLHLVPASRQLLISKLCRVPFVEQESGAVHKRSIAVALLFDHALPAADAGEADAESSVRLRRWIEAHFALIDFHLNALCRAVVANLRHRFAQQQQPPQQAQFEIGALQHCRRHALAVRRLCDELHALATRRRLYVGGAPFALLDEERRAALFVAAVRRLARYDSATNDFFLSTLVTALLTYNHSWLNVLEHTALLGDGAPPRHDEHTLAHQLRGLFGHWHGDPANQEHTCRTVVRGGEQLVIEHLLTVVGYFVRGVELRVSEHQPHMPPLFAAKHLKPDAALQGVELCDIRPLLPQPRPTAEAERLVDLRFSMVGGYEPGEQADADAAVTAPPDAAAAAAAADDDSTRRPGDAFSALVVSGIGADMSLRQVRRTLAMQLRATVDLPLLPTFGGEARQSRAAFCLLADVDSKMCELLSCTAAPHDGIGAGVLHYQLHPTDEHKADDRPRRMAHLQHQSDEFDDAEPAQGGNELEDTQRYGVQRTRLLPSEHIATTLGELRELAALDLAPKALCAYLDQRIAMLVALARVVATQMQHGDDDAERAAALCGVAPTDVPLVATIARLCGARW